MNNVHSQSNLQNAALELKLNENSYYWNDMKYLYNILFISHSNKLPLLSYIKREMKFCIFYE